VTAGTIVTAYAMFGASLATSTAARPRQIGDNAGWSHGHSARFERYDA